jgi:hypothetical protein
MAGNPKKRARREAIEAAKLERPDVNQTPTPAPTRPQESPKRLIGSVMRTDWQDAFLSAFSNSGNIRLSLFACDRQGVKVSRQTVANERKRSESFRERYEEAEEESVEVLEAEARRRAMDNSDTLLWGLLKAHKPQRYSEKAVHQTFNANIQATKIEFPDDAERNRKVYEVLEASGFVVPLHEWEKEKQKELNIDDADE